ncbi:MAG TPA: hypothetical protein VNN80_08010, partial [Polyangiaceae bacterium]|nr:hypothetical protein [Polyangiaceae bacterium]
MRPVFAAADGFNSALRWGGLGAAGGVNAASGLCIPGGVAATVAACADTAGGFAGDPCAGVGSPGTPDRRGGAGAREMGEGGAGGGGKRCV